MSWDKLLRRVAYQGVVLLGGLLLTGCFTPETSSSKMSQPKLIYQDPGFDLAALQAGHVAVGAVTRPDTDDYYAAEPIALRLFEQLHYHWPRVRVTPMTEVIRVVGAGPHKQMQEDFRGDGVLTPDQLTPLQLLKEHARYVLLVDIREEFSGWHSPWIQFQSTTASDDSSTTGGAEQTVYESKLSHKRFMRALFIIYDLETRQHVWIATASGHGKFTNAARSTEGPPAVPIPAEATPGDVMSGLMSQVMTKLPSPVMPKGAARNNAVPMPQTGKTTPLTTIE